jgi:hypothetical protein
LKLKFHYSAIILILLFFGVHGKLSAQIEQPVRAEIEIAWDESLYNIISLKKSGVLLIRQMINKTTSLREREWEIVRLDTDLKEVWKNSFIEDINFRLFGFDYRGRYAYLVYNRNENRNANLRLKRITVATGEVESFDLSNVVEMEITHFETLHDKVILGGYYNNRPVVAIISLITKLAVVLPNVFNEYADLVDIKIDDVNNIFTVLVSEREENKNYTIAVKNFNEEGELIKDTRIRTDQEKTLIAGKATNLDGQGQRVFGIYSNKKNYASQGFFIANINSDGTQSINYHTYGDLNNFFAFMPPNKQDRMMRKYRSKENGNTALFNQRMMLSSLVPTQNGHIVVATGYQPLFTDRNPNLARRYQYFPNSFGTDFMPFQQQQVNAYRYQFASIIAFDKSGRLIWDNMMEIMDKESQILEDLVHIYPEPYRTIMMYMRENEIVYQVVNRNDIIEPKTYKEVALEYEDDKIRSFTYEIEGLRHWYDEYFFAFGVQRIRNKEEVEVKSDRKVFYINKVLYR